MMHFETVEEPDDFNERVRERGNRWLKEHPKGRPPAFWNECRGDLAKGFRQLCGYSAMHLPNGTVDHFVSCDEDRSLAYEWFNYRFAAGWINSSKGRSKSSELLDPFQVEDGWFRILLPSLQLVIDESKIPTELMDRAHFVLERLHLRDDERVMKPRAQYYRMYREGNLSLEGLREFAPLIARAVESQQEG